MGGGSMLRPALRPILRPSGPRSRRIRSPSDHSPSSAVPSDNPASFAAAAVRTQSAGEPARQVFGPVPSEPEAQEALSQLMQKADKAGSAFPIRWSVSVVAPISKYFGIFCTDLNVFQCFSTVGSRKAGHAFLFRKSRAFTQISYSSADGDIQTSGVEQSKTQGTGAGVLSNRTRGELHAGNGANSNGLALSASTSRGLDRIRNSLDLLNWNPSFQKVVLSLSTDEAVWEAIMKNEAVQELHKCLIQAGRNEPLAFVGQDDFVPRILRWIIDISKTKIVELINQISDMIGALFRSGGFDETAEILNDVLKSAFMLTVMVLIVIVVSRIQAESNQ